MGKSTIAMFKHELWPKITKFGASCASGKIQVKMTEKHFDGLSCRDQLVNQWSDPWPISKLEGTDYNVSKKKQGRMPDKMWEYALNRRSEYMWKISDSIYMSEKMSNRMSEYMSTKIQNILWMEEILHQLIDDLSHYL